jgi:hypothetical protein
VGLTSEIENTRLSTRATFGGASFVFRSAPGHDHLMAPLNIYGIYLMFWGQQPMRHPDENKVGSKIEFLSRKSRVSKRPRKGFEQRVVFNFSQHFY